MAYKIVKKKERDINGEWSDQSLDNLKMHSFSKKKTMHGHTSESVNVVSIDDMGQWVGHYINDWVLNKIVG